MSIYSAISGVVGAGLSIYGQERANQENKEAATLAFQRQKELIEDANIYNSPSSQMARLRGAGLNPHLIYGNGAGNMVSASAGTPAPSHSENVMKDLGIYATMAQLDVQKRQVAVAEREVAVKESKSQSEIDVNLTQADKNRSEDEKNVQTLYNLMQDREHKNQLIELNKNILELESRMKSFSLQQQQELAPLIKINHMLQNETISNQINLSRISIALQKLQTNANVSKIASEVDLNVQEKKFLDEVQEYRKIGEAFKAAPAIRLGDKSDSAYNA